MELFLMSPPVRRARGGEHFVNECGNIFNARDIDLVGSGCGF